MSTYKILILNESKQKARQWLSKVADDEDVDDLLKRIISYDPTNTFKYTELLARLYYLTFNDSEYFDEVYYLRIYIHAICFALIIAFSSTVRLYTNILR